MANIEIDYECPFCKEGITIQIDDYYLFDIPNCPNCKKIMREVGRTQEDIYEREEDYNRNNERY
jgi:ribosomal protein L37AE/L43A